MEQTPSWETNWLAASQEIPRFLWNSKVHYRTHKHPPTVLKYEYGKILCLLKRQPEGISLQEIKQLTTTSWLSQSLIHQELH
jgi:hypothetical protein